jgi:hypothetical protein
MILHFSKWLELVSLRNCSNEGTAYAFLERMLSRFGVLVEVIINQAMDFCGDFQKLCEKALIDH